MTAEDGINRSVVRHFRERLLHEPDHIALPAGILRNGDVADAAHAQRLARDPHVKRIQADGRLDFAVLGNDQVMLRRGVFRLVKLGQQREKIALRFRLVLRKKYIIQHGQQCFALRGGAVTLIKLHGSSPYFSFMKSS